MTAYWAIFSIFATGALLGHTREAMRRVGIPLLAAACVLTLFVGLRWEVGPDWVSYQWIFRWHGFRDLGEALAGKDPGFGLLNLLVHALAGGFWLLNLLCAAIFIFGLTRFCGGLPNPWLGVSVAVPYLVIVIGMSALRQSVALGFVFLALRGMGVKPLWRTLLWILIGSLFHASAFIVAVLVGLSYTRNRLQSGLLLLVSLVPGYYVLFSTFDGYLERYGEQDIDSAGVYVRLLMNAVPAAILLWLGSKRFAPPGEVSFWRAVALLSIALLPVPFFIESTTAVDRLSLYAMPLQILVLACLPGEMSKSPAGRLVPTAAVLFYSALTLFVYFTFGSHADQYVPYKLADLW